MNSKKGKQKNKKIKKTKVEKRKMKSIQIITIPTVNINVQINHFNTKFHILNTLPTYKYIQIKTTFMCPRFHRGSAVRFSQALPGFRITSHHLYASLM